MFSTQSLLYALGIGAKKTLAASAAINWMLKDGLGRLARMTVATSYGQNFDSEIKRVRWTSALIYASCIVCEYATPFAPHLFVPLAGTANVGKAVSLTAFVSTQPAVMRSFSREDNLADITAKGQAQNMVMDNVGIALSAWLTWAFRHSPSGRVLLPLVMYPIATGGDLFGIYHELKSVHLRTLNRSRAELLMSHYLQTGQVLSPAAVSDLEPLFWPSALDQGPLPLRIVPVDQLFDGPHELATFAARKPSGAFALRVRPCRRGRLQPQSGHFLALAIDRDASHSDVLTAVYSACAARELLLADAAGSVSGGAPVAASGWNPWPLGIDAAECERRGDAGIQAAKSTVRQLTRQLEERDWRCNSFLLSKSEQIKYSIRI